LGTLGVGLFFLISGFVITFSVQKYTRKQFIISRFFRIWPTYFVGFCFTVLTVLLTTKYLNLPLPFPISAIWPHMIIGLRGLLQTQSIDGIVWTLEIELGFYILMFFISAWIKTSSFKAYLMPVAIFICILIIFSLLKDNLYFGEKYIKKIISFGPYFIFMFIGVAMNHFYTHQKNHLIYFLLGLGLLFLTFCGFELVNNQSLTNSTSYLFSFLIFLSAMFISKKIQFKSRFLEFLSKISYPLYIVHAVLGYIILYFVTTIAMFNNNISILIAFLVATLVAFMLHKFIEVPTHQFGKKLIEQNG